MIRSENPFSTRSIVPGAIQYHFLDPAQEAAVTASILDPNKKRLSVIGPHGTGKSTLLVHLLRDERVIARYPTASLLRVSANGSKWRAWRQASLHLHSRGLATIDGYEQFLAWQKAHLVLSAARMGCKLLISAHAPALGFVTVLTTQMNPEIEGRVLRTMLGSSHPIDPQTVMATGAWHASRAKHGQNLRESLFDMYDWYRDTVDAKNRQR